MLLPACPLTLSNRNGNPAIAIRSRRKPQHRPQKPQGKVPKHGRPVHHGLVANIVSEIMAVISALTIAEGMQDFFTLVN